MEIDRKYVHKFMMYDLLLLYHELRTWRLFETSDRFDVESVYNKFFQEAYC
jgi:hypothetical protein